MAIPKKLNTVKWELTGQSIITLQAWGAAFGAAASAASPAPSKVRYRTFLLLLQFFFIVANQRGEGD